MTHMTKLALAILSVLALPTLGRAQLLIQGSDFGNIETLAFAIGPPFEPGVWGVENAVRDTGSQGVVPRSFTWMLKMDDDGLVVTQAFQFVNISGRGPLEDTLEVEAWFNSDASAALAGLRLSYYVTNWPTTLPLDGRNMVLDNDVTTWQGLFFRSTIPAAANWVGVELQFNNASIGTNSGFVDGVSLAYIPAPGSMLAFGIGLASLVVRRRRK